MDSSRNPKYLRTVLEAVSEFSTAFRAFMDLYVENTEFARGMAPAAFPKDSSDPNDIAVARERVDIAAGKAGSAPGLTGVFYMVEGIGKVDPLAVWWSITQPKPVLEPSNILSACGMMTGRLEARIAELELEQAPSAGADDMHPLIWGSARSLWRGEHYREAVIAAAESLISQVKARTGRNDVAETVLWQQTFSANAPTAEQPRLRWPGDPTDRTVKSMNEALRYLPSGVQMGIRNPATHDQTPLSRPDALERLATLSLLARWIEYCELTTSEN